MLYEIQQTTVNIILALLCMPLHLRSVGSWKPLWPICALMTVFSWLWGLIIMENSSQNKNKINVMCESEENMHLFCPDSLCREYEGYQQYDGCEDGCFSPAIWLFSFHLVQGIQIQSIHSFQWSYWKKITVSENKVRILTLISEFWLYSQNCLRTLGMRKNSWNAVSTFKLVNILTAIITGLGRETLGL